MVWDIPCIDITPLLSSPGTEESLKTAKEISKAARDYGFLTIKNHGLDTEKWFAILKLIPDRHLRVIEIF